MADKPETSAKEDSSGSGKGSSLPIVAAVVFMGVLNVVAIGGLGYFMMTKAPPGAAAPPAATPADGHGDDDAAGASDGHDDDAAHGTPDGKGGAKRTPGVLHQMPNIVVRLKDVERDHHARISLALEFKETAEKAAVEASLPRVREACITYASDRRYDEMRGSRGLLDLKKFLNSKAKDIFGSEFQELYVTEFVAQ
jgi:flagellar basal body-associated protein FliL